ncbi:MAG: DeoR/GlpR transcriptional regulator [Clostridia bacterium]|nr:DeoR/GlpR transcriptional regulator [Clostridia bacterium]
MKTEMKITARREQVREMLGKKPFISLEELIEAFPDVSSMTLRRDIEYFEKHGEAIKVRGGARSMKFITTSMEAAFSKRLMENTVEKERVAKCAASMIETGRSVFLDSGTTMLALAKILPDERVTLVTTGPNIALELIKKSRPIVYIIGGMLNRDNISVVGSPAMEYVDDINVDMAFIVPSGMSAAGVSSGNYTECELKKKIIEKARQKVLVVTNAKVDKVLPYNVCGFDSVDLLITDSPLPDDISRECEKHGVKVIIA